MKNIWTIFQKEMLDTLRDRRTLMTMILMPLVLIPVLITVTATVSTSQMDSQREKKLRIALTDNGQGADLVKLLALRQDVQLYTDIEPFAYKDLVREDSLDLGVILDEAFDEQIRDGNTGKVSVYHNSTNPIPLDRFRNTLDSYNGKVLNLRLDSIGATMANITPTQMEEVDVYTQRESLGKMVGGFLPYIFVLFSLVGAMYPAIDLFTGEKERGTLETILTVPAHRLQILLGKMLTVALSGVLSGGLAILGIYLALKFNPEVPDAFKNVLLQILNPSSVSLLILMIIPLTFFFAGILIPASIYARSFKEAQSLIQPMLIVVILPLAVIASVPTIQLNMATAIIPVVNVGLASREVIAGTIDFGLLAVVFLSLLAFAGIGIGLCVRWFGQEGNILRR
ncbi:MAG: ABC transporter permease [Bacteroidota bacterium]